MHIQYANSGMSSSISADEIVNLDSPVISRTPSEIIETTITTTPGEITTTLQNHTITTTNDTNSSSDINDQLVT